MSERRRFTLDEKLFGRLVRGEPVLIETLSGTSIEVRLRNVRWDRMYFQIERAMRDAGVGEL